MQTTEVESLTTRNVYRFLHFSQSASRGIVSKQDPSSMSGWWGVFPSTKRVRVSSTGIVFGFLILHFFREQKTKWKKGADRGRSPIKLLYPMLQRLVSSVCPCECLPQCTLFAERLSWHCVQANRTPYRVCGFSPSNDKDFYPSKTCMRERAWPVTLFLSFFLLLGSEVLSSKIKKGGEGEALRSPIILYPILRRL